MYLGITKKTTLFYIEFFHFLLFLYSKNQDNGVLYFLTFNKVITLS
ncbi:hypothetical protein CCAND95_710005 [Capnocytophaga canis]|nr:hypothetical protein CCAND95_710005 [Capnocytophaga canis]